MPPDKKRYAFPLHEPCDRWVRLGVVAAELCYASGCPADNVCVGSCAAVVPGAEHLAAAAEQVRNEYWANHGVFVNGTRADPSQP